MTRLKGGFPCLSQFGHISLKVSKKEVMTYKNKFPKNQQTNKNTEFDPDFNSVEMQILHFLKPLLKCLIFWPYYHFSGIFEAICDQNWSKKETAFCKSVSDFLFAAIQRMALSNF